MSLDQRQAMDPLKIQPVWIARLLLIAYAVILTIRGTATLQCILLLTSLVILSWERRTSLKAAWLEVRWLLGPLLIFSLWIFAICAFWREPELLSPIYFTVDQTISQPWFSLDQWRRDVGQPMLAMVCGFWAFREAVARRWLFLAQGVWVMILVCQCMQQFYVGDLIIHGPILEGADYWVKGTFAVRGFSRDNIFFSYVLFLLTPGVFWLVTGRKTGWRGWFAWAMFLGLFYLIFLNKRRGTWLAVYLETLVLICWMGRKAWIPFLIGTTLMGLAAYQVRPHWFKREYDADRTGRIRIAKDIQPLLLKRPWVGVGYGKDTVIKNYWRVIYQQAHNTFLNLALETGFPGLLLWIGTLVVYGGRFWRDGPGDWEARIGLAFLIGFCVRNLTDDVWISSNAELFWFLIGTLMPERKQNQP